MTLKEKITQVILALNKESIKYPRMKTNDVTFMLAKLINDYYESDNNGWIKIESEDDLPKDEVDCFFIKDNLMYQGVWDNVLKGFYNGQQKINASHYQLIIKPEKPLY